MAASERERILPSSSNGGWSPSNIKPGGWLILLLLVGALAYWGTKHGRTGVNTAQTAVGTDAQSGAGGADLAGNLDAGQVANGNVLVSTTGTKQAWLEGQAAKFNSQNQGHVQMLKAVESRDAMQSIYNGKLQPTVWSPSSPVWTERLAQLRPNLLDESDPQSYRVVFKSPLVFLTTKSKAQTLRPILTGATPWTTLAASRRFKFGYADPLNASSGMLTMALIINEYARLHGSVDPVQATSSAGFRGFLGRLNQNLVKTDDEGSSKLEKAYEANPSSRDFITAYENAALTAISQNPSLTMIYPSPTANADQGAAVLSGSWVTPAQKATAQKFLQFIGGKDAQGDGVRYHFRPAVNGAQTLAATLSGTARTDFQASYTSVELPPYDALNEAAAQYRTTLK